jgi:phenylpropionate dioxygenase-like ring-hydroxylating dioxygenase large terminal subunit
MVQAIATNRELSLVGGNDPSCFDWKEVWYPVYYVQDLDRTKPLSFTLLGQNLVIWWDRTAAIWRVFEDKCPHRLAPLSEGRIAEDGALECPYHGWAFTGAGNCDRIPQQVDGGTAETSKRACVRSFPTAIRQGMLFVYPGQVDNAAKVDIPIVELLEESADEWVCIDTFRDLPYDALTLMENVLDSSHLPYTHHRSVGNRANASPVELEVLASGKWGFQGKWEEGPRRGKLGRQDTTFIAPGLMWHDLTSKQFGRTLTVVYATPISKGKCRLFARFPFKFATKLPGFLIKLSPRWYSHINQNAILEDDQIFLYMQERYLEANGGSDRFTKAFYLPTKEDLFVIELRQWVNHYSIDPFPGDVLPPAIPKTQQLLDRYHSHTVNCASCRTALANIQRLRQGVAIMGAIACIISPLLAVTLGQGSVTAIAFLTFLSLFCGAGWIGLGRLERQFFEGRSIPPRNLPEPKRGQKP